MRIRIRIDIEPRTLHFRFPAGTSRGIYTERRNWLLRMTSPDDRAFCGVGECAPLPDLSCDYGAHYAEQLRAACDEVERIGRIDTEALRPFPSILFGLETAWLSAQAAANGRRVLFDTPFTRGERGIVTNGLVWMGDHATMARRLAEKLSQGFRCIKVKIGAIGFDDELDLLTRARALYNTECVELRVDANGAFTPSEAHDKLRRLATYGLHSIEQPLRAGQWEEMAALCRACIVPIALDEELIGVTRPEDKRALLDTVRPQYLVLKPSLHGGFAGCEEWISLATERGIGWWVTSALESNVGLSAISQWLSVRIGDSAMPQGLGTGELYTDNISVPALRMEGEKLWYRP